MHDINDRLINLDRVASRITDETASRLRTQGRDVLKLSGYPNTPLPDDVLAIARDAVAQIAQPPSQGLLELRETLDDELAGELGYSIGPEQVLITNGAMHALSLVFRSLISPGDEVAMFSPCYFYHGPIELSQGVVRRIPLKRENGFAFDFERLAETLTEKTKVLLINTPVNPTGYVATAADIERIAELAERHNLLVVTDEVYHAFTYDGHRHLSLLSIPELRKRTIMIRSFTKSYGLHVWRTGFLTAPPSLIAGMLKLIEWDVLGLSYLNQKVAEVVLRSSRQWLNVIKADMRRNRDVLTAGLQAIVGLNVHLPQAGCFLFLDTANIGLPDCVIAKQLLEDYGIPCTPGSSHYHPDAIRIAYGGELSTVREAITRLRTAFAKIERNP